MNRNRARLARSMWGVTMKKMIACCFFGLLAGCAADGERNVPVVTPDSSVADETIAASHVPSGMQMGPFYVSALNEGCYELIPAGGGSSQIQALCQRGETWVVMPKIYMDKPPRSASSAWR